MNPLAHAGFGLLAAYGAGRLAARYRLPRVTGYLLAGILLGPSLLGRFAGSLPAPLAALVLPSSVLVALDGVKGLALAMILFSVGLSYDARSLRGGGKEGIVLAVTDIGLTFLCVFAGVFLFTGFAHPGLSALLAAAAVATAPAATMLVLREMESAGRTTQTLPFLLGLNNFASLLFFGVLFGFFFTRDIGGGLSRLGSAILLGAGGGLLLALLLRLTDSARASLVFSLGTIAATWGAAPSIGADPMLASLVLGATLANSSDKRDTVKTMLSGIDYPFYVLFFVLSGAGLHLGALVGQGLPKDVAASMVALAIFGYVVFRAAGKTAAGFLARSFGYAQEVPRRIGVALLAQAGVAIGLADMMQRAAANDPSLAHSAHLFSVIVLSAVVVFELFGPLAVRYVVVHAGEVRVLHLLPERASEGMWAAAADTLDHLRSSLGLSFLGREVERGEIRAVDLMRRNVATIPADARFPEVLKAFSRAPYDQFPVVSKDGRYCGAIQYRELRGVLFEDVLEEVTVAVDLVSLKAVTCSPETTLPELIDIFHEGHGEFGFLPVVEPGTEESPPRCVGIVDQRDAMVAYRKHR